jgi:heme oxygenase
MANAISISKNLVHMRTNGETGEQFASISVPPRGKGLPWGNFTVNADAVTDDPFHEGRVLVNLDAAEKTFVSFGQGDARKSFGYAPATLAKRMAKVSA